ncbi:uncharacterized protein LOC142622596 [Castanea sativa]|uniref:uncharacterized protein LOC142622596 n=1 Tax=Castanea sativa TaxID=21020 RepID=UPI003F652111
MANLRFTLEIHHGGYFGWNPDLVYLDGCVSIIDEVDPDRLSLFEIQDICGELGAPSTNTFHYLIPGGNLEQGLMVINGDDDVLNMCDIHDAWPLDRIILYVEGGEEPLVIEEQIGIEEVGGQDGGDEHEVGQNDGDVHEVGQNDDDVHEGGNVDAKGGGGQDCLDFDWLEEGFEGPGFDDDVFWNLDDGRSTHGVRDSAAPHRPTIAENDKELAIRSSAIENECVEEGEWIDPPIKDDMESLVGSDDDQLALAATKEPEFNIQTDMRKSVLMKGMKFPNSKVFREALREYAIRKPVDIKFNSN